MTKQSAQMKSNFDRRPGDHYPTIDTRCLDGLLKYMPLTESNIVDVCSDQGSAIVDDLRRRKYKAFGVSNAFCSNADLIQAAGGHSVDYIVTNTPYELSKVDRIMWRQIKRIEDREIVAAAFLLRSTFDHAMKRQLMFRHPFYAGQIKLCFRPWWTESRDKSPFHVYAWQIFRIQQISFSPTVAYYYPPYEKRYAADIHKYKCRQCGQKSRIKYTSQDKVGACDLCNDPEYTLEGIE